MAQSTGRRVPAQRDHALPFVNQRSWTTEKTILVHPLARYVQIQSPASPNAEIVKPPYHALGSTSEKQPSGRVHAGISKGTAVTDTQIQPSCGSYAQKAPSIGPGKTSSQPCSS